MESKKKLSVKFYIPPPLWVKYFKFMGKTIKWGRISGVVQGMEGEERFGGGLMVNYITPAKNITLSGLFDHQGQKIKLDFFFDRKLFVIKCNMLIFCYRLKSCINLEEVKITKTFRYLVRFKQNPDPEF